MGIFSGLFKKKDTNVSVNNNGVVGEAIEPIEVPVEPAPIIVDQSNVLEQMQNNFAIESAREDEEARLEEDPMSVFNQNITLDNNNPMAIFGVESEENKKEDN